MAVVLLLVVVVSVPALVEQPVLQSGLVLVWVSVLQ